MSITPDAPIYAPPAVIGGDLVMEGRIEDGRLMLSAYRGGVLVTAYEFLGGAGLFRAGDQVVSLDAIAEARRRIRITLAIALSAAGWSYRRIGRALDVDPTQVSRWINGGGGR